MLASVLHKHLDGLDEIDARAKAKIDKVIVSIDIKALMDDPKEELGRVVDEIDKMIVDEFQPLAHADGVKLAKEIKKRDVKIDPSNDPTKNEGLAK